jgi:hypothetical protein
MQTYSFLDIVAAFVGPGIAVSLGNGAGNSEEGISIDPAGDKDTMTIGADGKGMHSLHADKSGRVVVRLMKTSPINGILSAAYAFQTSSGSTHGQNTLTITDMNRGDVITCRQVAFAKAPNITYGKEAGIYEWDFNCIEIDRTLSAA